MTVPLSYRLGEYLGCGGYSLVYQAIEENSGRTVAVKKSRVSQKVKRPILRYESTVIQLLQGHPAIPEVYGYGQLPHFEYLAMELLGPSVKECAAGRVPVKTVISVTEQTLSALEHVHKCGFVHRDVKPENLLCSLTDPSKIMLIDFGISLRIKSSPPQKHNPLKESKRILFVGTLHWASLNSHNGIGESLTPVFQKMKRIRAAKAAISSDELGVDFPPEFGYLLDYSRRLEYDGIPDYEDLRKRFAGLNGRGEDTGGPLEWSSAEISQEPTSFKVAHDEDDEDGMGSGEDRNKDSNEERNTDSEENFSNSYYSLDIGLWEIHGARDRNLTLPIEQVEQAHLSSIPEIVEHRLKTSIKAPSGTDAGKVLSRTVANAELPQAGVLQTYTERFSISQFTMRLNQLRRS
ncbi:kinase-like domain-containing protein [Crucibulum laeve]|uniref:non-specific serine/threonine protein kinase n=1 Tax=Crucibulum laeve TaxID=68775 RepID=A0A5C3MBA5_9AGAR|nr:kinase-like domain-containing protein [Crucibulum laeve]